MNLIEARQQKHMTQSELAKRSGISQAEISRIEHGKHNPSIKLLQRLAEGLGMSLQVAFVPIKLKPL